MSLNRSFCYSVLMQSDGLYGKIIVLPNKPCLQKKMKDISLEGDLPFGKKSLVQLQWANIKIEICLMACKRKLLLQWDGYFEKRVVIEN